MKYNVGEMTSEGFTTAFIIVFENGIVLRSTPVEWLSVDEKQELSQRFDDVVQQMKDGTLQFNSSFIL